MTLLRKLYDLYREEDPLEFGRRVGEWLLLRSPVATDGSRGWYWRTAPHLNRAFARADTAAALIPPEPYRLHWVDPEAISKFTRRSYPTDAGFESLFGAVRDGDWDVRPASEAPTVGDPAEEGGELLARDLFYADWLEETPLYRSFEAHFADGVEWTDTEFVAEILDRTDAKHDPWHDCHDRAAVLERCGWMDDTYERLADVGFADPLYEASKGPHHLGFRDALAKATVVDVGRDGDLLLVDGRHRLCMAKVLGLDRVPVVLCVRHEAWMATRDAVARGEVERDPHPDLPPAGCAPAYE